MRLGTPNGRIGTHILRGPREPEVDHLHLLADEDVRRLEIAVNDPALMRVLDRIAHLPKEIEPRPQREPAGFRKHRERLSRDEFHRQIRLPRVADPRLENACDSGMSQPRHEPRLALEAFQKLLVVEEFQREQLQRNLAFERFLPRTINCPHSPTPEERSEDEIPKIRGSILRVIQSRERTRHETNRTDTHRCGRRKRGPATRTKCRMMAHYAFLVRKRHRVTSDVTHRGKMRRRSGGAANTLPERDGWGTVGDGLAWRMKLQNSRSRKSGRGHRIPETQNIGGDITMDRGAKEHASKSVKRF